MGRELRTSLRAPPVRGLTRAERETVIRWDEEAKLVRVWSASPAVWRRLARLGVEPAHETTRNGELISKGYLMPLGRFRWGLKGRPGGKGDPGALARWKQANWQAHGSQNADGGVPA